jgi:phosphatidylglycerophosphate synthase
MQSVIAIPEFVVSMDQQETTELLIQPVAGVPLLMRAVVTATRAGANEILLICPAELNENLVQQFVQESRTRYGVQIRAVQLDDFDPRAWSSWTVLKPYLGDQFLWMPWNWITTKNFLTRLPSVDTSSVDWAQPVHVTLREVNHDISSSTLPGVRGVAVTSPADIAQAERFLVAHSGKLLDGIHTSFNRRLCRPFVRMLSHTSITPNAVTFGGVLVSVLSAIAFAQGSYLYSVLGAFLFYIAGLFDEMDGMLARVKFAESPRGTWLEGFADGLSYLLLFTGMAFGLSRTWGPIAVWMGIALLVGAALSLITTSLQRKRATTPDRPNEYLGRFYQLLEKDSGNWISRTVRQVQAFQRRGILIIYIVLFTLIGALPLVFFLATLGAHLTWILTLYFNDRFFSQPAQSGAKASPLKEAL